MTSGFDHALVGALLLTGFLMLPSRRPVILLRLLAVQGALLALAAAWQGWAQESLPLAVVALVVLASQAAAVPIALRRLEWGPPEPGLPILPAMLLGCGLVALAILVVLPVAPGVTAMARQDLALILAFLLVGLLGLALKTLPVGTAYAVWTGVGTVGTALLGVWLFGEPATAARLACIGLIVAGIAGLKLAA